MIPAPRHGESRTTQGRGQIIQTIIAFVRVTYIGIELFLDLKVGLSVVHSMLTHALSLSLSLSPSLPLSLSLSLDRKSTRLNSSH